VIEGLWIVQYHGPQGFGGGVVVFMNGQLLGGDSGFTYSGAYELKGEILKANVSVKHFDPSIPNVLGVPGDFDLLIEGKMEGNEINGTGALVNFPDSKIVVRLKKETDLK
jgi:hypothetical protein